jgi:hypothetical protein
LLSSSSRKDTMTTRNRSIRTATAGGMLAAGLTLLATTGSAHADTIWREAEAVRDTFYGTITSPLQIKDAQDASNGSFIEVLAGNNNNTAMPAAGQICHHFSVVTAGSYRVWGRVIAASTSDDSFWVKVDAGAPINWTLPVGAAWHWDMVHPNGGTTSLFTLAAGDHDICFGYREDGARLDAFVITNTTTYNPASPPAVAPAAPATVETWGEKTRVQVSWSFSPGAKKYRIDRQQGGATQPFTTLTTVLASQLTYVDVTPNVTSSCYRIYAVNDYGTSLASDACADSRLNQLVEAESFSLTAPMVAGPDPQSPTLIQSPTVSSSTTVAPSSGYARYDFRFGEAHTVKVWGVVEATSSAHDSFWVRVDFGAWINWNNWKIQYNADCQWDDVHNSSTDSKPVMFNLGAGSHMLEFAYRESGSQLDKVYITENTSLVGLGGCGD